MNNLKIKINGTEISLENSKPIASKFVSDDNETNKLYAAISKEADDLSKQIKAYKLLSDVKTVESFGYKSTEALEDNKQGIGSKIVEKIKDFLQRIANFFRTIGQKISSIFIKQKVEKIQDQSIKTKFVTTCGKITDALKKYDAGVTDKLRKLEAMTAGARDEAFDTVSSATSTEVEKQRAGIISKSNSILNRYCSSILSTQSAMADTTKANLKQLYNRCLSSANSVLDSVDRIIESAAREFSPETTKEAIDTTFAPLHQKLDGILTEGEEQYKDIANMMQQQ